MKNAHIGSFINQRTKRGRKGNLLITRALESARAIFELSLLRSMSLKFRFGGQFKGMTD